ncbi:MAG: hypothetical protein WB297_03050 [Actinomycetota bacterium]
MRATRDAEERPKEGDVELPEHWAAQRKAVREWLDEVEDAELKAASDVLDAMIADLVAGREVEPFQFTAETEREEVAFRALVEMDRWLGDQ